MTRKTWKQTAMALSIAFIFVLGLSAGASAQTRADFAMMDMVGINTATGDSGDSTSAQCGVVRSLNGGAVPFVMSIQLTNRSTVIGGTAGYVRVEYRDETFTDFAIGLDSTISLTIAGGSSFGKDDIIKVKPKPGDNLALIGHVTASTTKGRAHPSLPEQTIAVTYLCSDSRIP